MIVSRSPGSGCVQVYHGPRDLCVSNNPGSHAVGQEVAVVLDETVTHAVDAGCDASPNAGCHVGYEMTAPPPNGGSAGLGFYVTDEPGVCVYGQDPDACL